ncbi:MAG: hypothetical protein N2C14_21590 [Planctomycetales bacterium]
MTYSFPPMFYGISSNGGEIEMAQTQKETIEYDGEFLAEWNHFCDSKGYVKRQASHACRIAFMQMLSAEQREEMMNEAMRHVAKSKASRKPAD